MRSSEKEQSSQCEVATIEDADTVFFVPPECSKGGPQAGMEQDVHRLILLAVTVVAMDELQEFVHLLFRNRFPGHGIIYRHSCCNAGIC